MYLFCGQKTSRKQVNIFKKFEIISNYYPQLLLIVINYINRKYSYPKYYSKIQKLNEIQLQY